MKTQMKVLAFILGLCGNSLAATLTLFDVSQSSGSGTAYYNGQFNYQTIDTWSGSYNLGATGTVSGSSSLPDPGRESSSSGSFMADHTFGPVSWDLSGWVQGSIDAGLGNSGSIYPTISNLAIVSTGLSFYVDTPFTITLTGMVLDTYAGATSSNPNFAPDNAASVRLFAEILDGVIVNQYLANWNSNSSSGGTYTGSFSSGVFRLDVFAGSSLSSNVPDDYGTQYSSYDAVMSVQPIPEPSSVLLLTAAGFYPLLRRRRRC
jgi:hypothetical protein